MSTNSHVYIVKDDAINVVLGVYASYVSASMCKQREQKIVDTHLQDPAIERFEGVQPEIVILKMPVME